MITTKKISLLDAWLARHDPLSIFMDLENRAPNREFGGFLSLDVVVPAHECLELGAESLEEAWQKTQDYVTSALSLIEAEAPVWLDRYEVEMIRESLGEPPRQCYPIYLITVGEGSAEKLVYVGKTSSNHRRFRSGHAAFCKLLNPQYDGQPKRIYLGTVLLLTDDNSYFPLEWIKPLDRADSILKSVEAQLIYSYKPELNTHHIRTNNAEWPLSLHIQNFTDVTSFLNDEICWP